MEIRVQDVEEHFNDPHVSEFHYAANNHSIYWLQGPIFLLPKRNGNIILGNIGVAPVFPHLFLTPRFVTIFTAKSPAVMSGRRPMFSGEYGSTTPTGRIHWLVYNIYCGLS